MLAFWKADKLRQAPTKALLGKLEKAYNAKVARIEESRTMLPEAKQLEKTEAGRDFGSDYRRMRREILAGYDAGLAETKKQANPPTTNAELERMSLLTSVHLPVWQRSPGNLVMDAAAFEEQGDVAGLKLARQHVGLLAQSQRSGAAASIGEALDDHKTDAVVKAETEGRSLQLERDHFELASSMRERGMIAARAGQYRQWSPRETAVPAEAPEAEPVEAVAS
jgi:hypothetical protein